jgi:hypothetical protein
VKSLSIITEGDPFSDKIPVCAKLHYPVVITIRNIYTSVGTDINAERCIKRHRGGQNVFWKIAGSVSRVFDNFAVSAVKFCYIIEVPCIVSADRQWNESKWECTSREIIAELIKLYYPPAYRIFNYKHFTVQAYININRAYQ